MEEVTVTATRTESLLSETPIAMTALTPDSMRDSGITDATKLNDVVPNVRLTESNGDYRVAIRGVSSTDTTEKGDPSVAFMQNGIYIARSQDIVGSFFDLERVEVLRGPQGTLYGRNTTAGVINVLSARPKNEFEASVDMELGNYGTENFTGMVNVPLNDNLAMRAAVNREKRDTVLEGPGAKNLDAFRDNLTGRLSLGGDYDKFEFVVVGEASQAEGSVFNILPISNFFPDGYATTPTIDPRYHAAGSTDDLLNVPFEITAPDSRDEDRWSLMTEATYHFDNFSLTYLGSVRDADREFNRNYMVLGSIPNPATFVGSFEQSSHELRIAFGQDKPLHGQAGLYYFKEEIDLELNLGNPIASMFFGENAVGYAFPQGPVEAESKAAFTELTYNITNDLHVTGGIRYTEDEKSREGATVLDVQDPDTGVVTRTVLNENLAADDWTKTTWKLGVDYFLGDLGMIYASVATGYKAGGFNDGCVEGSGIGCTQPAELLYYGPEELTSIEAGFKFSLLEDTLNLNASVFTYDYTEKQIEATIVNPPARVTRNAGEAGIEGIEIDGIWLPYENGKLEFSATWLDAVYDDFVPDEANYPDLNFKGKYLDHAPENTFRLSYTHTFPLSIGGYLDANVSSLYSSEYYIVDLPNVSQFKQPSYTKTNVTLTYHSEDDSWYVQAYGKNLEDEITLGSATSGFFGAANVEDPRTYGVRAGMKF
ncbi:TonB-dependent receptor [Aestuariicella hydrocarbonica]|uniref:TonB-dependent receptor n=1 Tax=Pseudomaricurvus hydrocarbonicus TaxID=1470433 RepID=A0A9E5T1F1_9GAMM|nr:TonB-dependent receptor [Aestuariicella hydrocarbonica]